MYVLMEEDDFHVYQVRFSAAENHEKRDSMAVNKPQANTPFKTLAPYQFILLKTFRKSGVAVATPMWFALRDDKLYVNTTSSTGKMKRIRNNRQVQVTPCTRFGAVLSDGTELEGQARELIAGEAQVARDLLIKKYGLPLRAFLLFGNLGKTSRVFIEIALRVGSDDEGE